MRRRLRPWISVFWLVFGLASGVRAESGVPVKLAGPSSGQAAKTAASHKRGPRPQVPQSQLPEDVPHPAPDDRARRAIAEGATREEKQAGPPDEQLLDLRQAEKILFGQRPRGLQSGWSFTLPEPSQDAGRTLGLPLVDRAQITESEIPKEELEWLRSLTKPDLPVRLDQRVVTYLKFYRDSPRGRTIAAIWTRKSGRYVAEMKARFRRAGLPTDLVWLSMIESGHNPTIKSPAGAVGLWQFIPESGRMYGLTVDRWVDERRDPARSTQAAIRFLSDLYSRFGNWELAMGAYNMGYAGMSRAIAKYSTNDYWALSRMESGIPWETSLYVPKIFALAIVMNNRSAFGVGNTQLDPSVAFDTIYVEPATSLSDIAQAANMDVSSLSQLNPQYLAARLPPNGPREGQNWPVRVLAKSGEATLAKLAEKAGGRVTTHRVRLGETFENVAEDFGVRESSLERLNASVSDDELRPGTVLLLPTAARPRSVDEQRDVVITRQTMPAKDQRRVFYEVVAGDTLARIAEHFGVSETELCRTNLINPDAHLRRGMMLQVLVDRDAQLDHIRLIEEKDARVLLAASPEFHEAVEERKGKRRVQIVVQKGDTLYKLGAKYGMSVGSMERVNRRSRKSPLIPGERLIVYTERKEAASVTDEGREPLPPLPEGGSGG